MTTKEKLRNYLFSKVDDDESFDDSPIKVADKNDEELNYERWYVASIHTRRSEVIKGVLSKPLAGQKVGDRIIAPYKSRQPAFS